VQRYNNHHEHLSKKEIIDTTNINEILNNNNNKNELNVDNFVLNETENGDYLDDNIDEDKYTTRPRVNTYDHSRLPSNQIRKHLNGVLLQKTMQNKKKKKKQRKSNILDSNCAHDHSHHDDSDSDLEEATLKNVVSSKGKFLSLLQARNISKKLL